MKVEIEIDEVKKQIISLKGTENFNPLVLAKIFNTLSFQCMNMIKLEFKKDEKIIVPKKNIITPN